MKKITSLLSILLCIQTFAGEPLFLEGNKQYTNGDYLAAIALYDSILINQMESSELYYNLGNCYYKTQDWANAIWHYEKSLQLKKNEKTIQNLELVKLKIIDRIEPLPQLFYKKWWSSLTQLLNTQAWQILALLCISFIFILQLISQFTLAKNRLITKIFSILSVIILLITQTSFHNNSTKKEAIIFSETITVNSAPTNNSVNLFTLHAGSKVEIIDSIGNWINIKIDNGNSGWIIQNSIKEL